MKKSLYLLFFLSFTGIGVFAQFHITTESLLKQLAVSGTEQHIFVKGNDLKTVVCLDKNEAEQTLDVTNRTGIRIRKKDSSKTTFYFNTVILTDSTITGSKTHFFNALIKPIPLSDISIIEIMR